MHLRYAFVADSTNVSQDGRLNALGIFDRLYAHQFPAVHRELHLVTSFETEPGDAGREVEILVELIDMDGRKMADVQGTLRLGDGKQVINQIHVFNELYFPTPGGYQFSIFLNKDLITRVLIELAIVEC